LQLTELTLGRSSSERSTFVRINYVTKISLNEKDMIYLSKQKLVSDQFR